MANTKSAIKRIRRISRQTIVNKSRKSKYRNAIKKMNILLESKKKKEALEFLPKLNSQLMKVAKKRYDEIYNNFIKEDFLEKVTGYYNNILFSNGSHLHHF